MNKHRLFRILAVLILAGLAYGTWWFLSRSPERGAATPVSEEPADSPKAQGEVTFFTKDGASRKVAVELARTPEERIKGLMYRTSLPQHAGMLFVFEEASPRGFWMKNTPISLDIIYIGADSTIVSVRKNTIPFSEETLPSDGPARYVVEVNAGYTDRYHINAGDRVQFRLY